MREDQVRDQDQEPHAAHDEERRDHPDRRVDLDQGAHGVPSRAAGAAAGEASVAAGEAGAGIIRGGAVRIEIVRAWARARSSETETSSFLKNKFG